MEYASNGKGNLGVTLGAIGTGLGVLGELRFDVGDLDKLYRYIQEA